MYRRPYRFVVAPLLPIAKRGLLAAWWLLAIPTSLWAASFSVSPIRVPLPPQSHVAAVTVTNSQATPLVLRLSAMHWSQSDDGEDDYASTNDLVIGPWLLKIEPGTPRLIRFGVPAPAGDTEATYRLFLEEQAPTSSEAAAQLNVVMRFGLPVFVAPAVERVSAHLEAITRDGDALAVGVRNTGNVHVIVDSVSVDSTKPQRSEHAYLLAHAARTYHVPLAPCTAEMLQVTVQMDRLTFAERVPAAGLCR